MITLQYNFRFEAAHRLCKDYPGICRNIHGHSWRGMIEVACPELDQYDMGIDFSILGEFAKQIESEYDHCLIVYDQDFPLIQFCKQNQQRYVALSSNPTSEAIVKDIYQKSLVFFKQRDLDIKVSKIEIEETCQTRCSFIPD